MPGEAWGGMGKLGGAWGSLGKPGGAWESLGLLVEASDEASNKRMIPDGFPIGICIAAKNSMHIRCVRANQC